MKYFMLFLLLVCQAHAQTVQVDSSGCVISHSAAEQVPTTSAVTVVPSTALPANSHLFDQYGRCWFTATNGGPIVKLVTPRWPADAGVKAMLQGTAFSAIDQLNVKIAGLREWQATEILVKDRSAELNAVIAQRAALITILQGP